MDVRGIGAQMLPDFFVIDGTDIADIGRQLVQPIAEPQVPHASTVVAARAERRHAAVDGAIGGAQREAGCGGQIKCEHNRPATII
jgi:hypothetical protein